jgi:hypothetical protein
MRIFMEPITRGKVAPPRRFVVISNTFQLGTILYLGVLAGEYPANFLLQKLPVAKFLSAK